MHDLLERNSLYEQHNQDMEQELASIRRRLSVANAAAAAADAIPSATLVSAAGDAAGDVGELEVGLLLRG